MYAVDPLVLNHRTSEIILLYQKHFHFEYCTSHQSYKSGISGRVSHKDDKTELLLRTSRNHTASYVNRDAL